MSRAVVTGKHETTRSYMITDIHIHDIHIHVTREPPVTILNDDLSDESEPRGGSRISKGGVDGRPYLLTRHLGNYPQDPGNEVAIKPEHRLSTWVGKRERFPTNFAIMSQSESYFASLGVVKWLPCELLREKWRQTTKRGVTTTRHERELIFLSLFIFYFK